MNNKKKPKFMRQEWFKKPSLGIKWRAPKGNQSKLRRHIKGKGFMPTVGYGSPRSTRGMHPCGLWEVVICNPSQMDMLIKENSAIKISATVGMRKREEILKKAKEKGLKVLNPTKVDHRKEHKPAAKTEHKEEQKPAATEHKHEHKEEKK